MPERHFPEPWSVEELDTCFVVKDLNGQALAYMYFEKEPRRRHRRSELLTRDEAQRKAPVSVSYMNAFHTSTEQLAGVLKKVNPEVTVLYHYVTFTPWNATDQERGVKEIKNFGYNGVVIQSQDADIF